MTVYYVDDGGSSTAPYDTWAKAAPTFAALVAGAGTALNTGGNVIYVGADSVSSGDGTAAFNGPTSGGPVYIISATVGTTTYAKSSSNQISVASGGATWSGNFAIFGVQFHVSDATAFTLNTMSAASAAESGIYTEDCTFKPGSNRKTVLSNGSSVNWARNRHVRPTFSAANDSGAQSASFVEVRYQGELHDVTFVDSGSHRTGTAVDWTNIVTPSVISGADFSNLSAISAIVNVAGAQGRGFLTNCKTAASPTWETGAKWAGCMMTVTNSGSADDPAFLYYSDYFGKVTSDTTNYRNSGASVETVPVSWKMVSNTHCYTNATLNTPWMYGTISSTGSKTFDVYITQDGGAGDLTDAEVWLEVEYFGTSNVAKYTLVDDRCSVSGFYSAAAAQTDDVTSTWAGTITETYMQKLSVTTTVNEDGLFRARVILGKASTTLYVDPMVTVS